jgi:hypothetical protein
MNDAPPDPDPVKAALFEAMKKVNAWRGHCVECFARIEAAATEMLKAIPVPKSDPPSRMPHLFGPRITALAAAVSEGGSLAVHGGPVRKALAKLDPLLEYRNVLVHATGSVWIGAHGGWVWRYCFTPSARGGAEQIGVLTHDEAAALEKSLASLARSLSDCLKTLRAKIA